MVGKRKDLALFFKVKIVDHKDRGYEVCVRQRKFNFDARAPVNQINNVL